jgi:hypothetical protein
MNNRTKTKPNVASAPRIQELSLSHKALEISEKNPDEPTWLLSARKAGFMSFDKLGLPTLQDEDWRFTNVAPIAKMSLAPVVKPEQHGLTEKLLSQFPFAALVGSQLVFVNGQFVPELSSLAQLPGDEPRRGVGH